MKLSRDPAVAVPLEAIVTVAEICFYSGIDEAQELPLIQDIIDSVSQFLDAPEGALGLSLAEQRLVLNLDFFPAYGEAIRLPYPPVRSIESIKYTNKDGRTVNWYSAAQGVLGRLTAAHHEVVAGYEFVGYASAASATGAVGQLEGMAAADIAGLYTATVKTTNLDSLSMVEQGKTYTRRTQEGRAPALVIIDGTPYEVSAAINTVYNEVIGFAGFTAGEAYKVQILFPNGAAWISEGPADLPAKAFKVRLYHTPTGYPYILPEKGQAWPSDYRRESPDVVEIKINTGGNIPKPVKIAARMMALDLLDNRHLNYYGRLASIIKNPSFDRLLCNYIMSGDGDLV